MFDKPNPKQNFYDLESQILNWWKENEILEKSIDQRPVENAKTFYDGPITANGEPHHGHMLTFAMKDVIPRYWTMKGYRVARSLGWDCQGIPVEYEIEKKLGFKEKRDIENYGIAKFNQLCRESVLEYRGAIVELEEMMGRLTNEDEEYATMDADYIESIWWSLKELYENELLYEGFKVVPYSTRAGTTLSNAEVALGGYSKIIDPAITVEFELEDEKGTFVLAWTTTPWTIPGNLGLAVGEKIKYVKVQSGDKKYIVAKDLVEDVFNDKDHEVIEEMTSKDLVGRKYTPPFDFFVGNENAHQIYEGFHVTTESGTGIVHLAPYGAEDNEIFQEVGIQSFDYLDDQGDFTDMVSKYQGMFYKKASKYIVEDLKELDRLFSHEKYEHDMPMCWRTKTPLIYKPITSWYIKMSSLRGELVKNNSKIKWVPDHVKEGRFGNWLAEIKDWGISRLRYWGTPLPIWKSESGQIKIIGSFEELKELSGVELEDPHRPFVDDITFELDGETYTRIPDVIDVWYDSGAMPFARFHYPFENKDRFEGKFPADYISESVDQTRGWFYSLMAISTALFKKEAFKNVVMSGFVLDDKGVKLSKSKGNYTSPKPMIEQHGADTIRLNFFSTPISAGEDTTISERTLKLQKQEAILPLWNIFSYLITYANMHNWKPTEEHAYNERMVTEDSHPWDHIPFDDIENNLDAWVLLKLQKAIKEVTAQLEDYNVPKATRAIKELISEISKWFIRSSRDRFADGEVRAIETLYYVLVETVKLLASFAPFISEHIYKQLVVNELEGQKESIHLTDFPIADEKFLDQYSILENEMEVLRKVAELGHNLRVENGMRVRQPLSELSVKLANKDVNTLTPWMEALLMNELNVISVRDAANIDETETIKVSIDGNMGVEVGLNIELTPELKEAGMKRETIRGWQASRKKKKLKMGEEVTLHVHGDTDEVKSFLERNLQEIAEPTATKPMLVSEKIENPDGTANLGEGTISWVIKT